MSDRWMITQWAHSWINLDLKIRLTTNAPCHLWLYHTTSPPRLHLRTKIDRGLSKRAAPDYCFVEYTGIEQQEPGDTPTHTFIFPGWTYCETRYWIFQGTINGIPSPSRSPIFQLHAFDVEDVPPFYPPFSNGDFEDWIDPSTPAIWTDASYGSGTSILAQESTIVHSGSHSIKMQIASQPVGSQFTWVRQIFDAIPYRGFPTTFSFWINFPNYIKADYGWVAYGEEFPQLYWYQFWLYGKPWWRQRSRIHTIPLTANYIVLSIGLRCYNAPELETAYFDLVQISA